MNRVVVFIGLLLLLPMVAGATPQQVYHQAISVAAVGGDGEAVARLQGAAAVLPATNIWQSRMVLASTLLDMRQHQSFTLLQAAQNSTHLSLAAAYLQGQPRPEVKSSWLPALLASVFPGAGHAWQGRWNDAIVAAIMVWPMLILTLWAAYRRMGPVTIFFAMMTAWLWSGTIFSAISLVERDGFETYLIWWQGLWQASALPGRPW